MSSTKGKDRVQIQPGTFGRKEVIVDVRTDAHETLFGKGQAWWTELDGMLCCPDAPVEMRHIDRVDAIEHAQSLVRAKKWGK